MKRQILIVSDSHGLTKELEQIKERHNVDAYIHCGDSELSNNHRALKNFTIVKGNCDGDASFEHEEMIVIQGVKFFITHGHLYNVKSHLINLSYRAEEMDAKIICYGHSHIAGVQRIGDQIFINPGSIRYPRGRTEKTYALMIFDESLQKVSITFYTLYGDIINSLYYETSLK